MFIAENSNTEKYKESGGHSVYRPERTMVNILGSFQKIKKTYLHPIQMPAVVSCTLRLERIVMNPLALPWRRIHVHLSCIL